MNKLENLRDNKKQVLDAPTSMYDSHVETNSRISALTCLSGYQSSEERLICLRTWFKLPEGY
jgi:hypothetical protein